MYILFLILIIEQGGGMLKKLLLAVAMVLATMSVALADVDVNKADQAALDSIKGIGPVMSRAILAERTKGGNFKNWSDFQSRVKGIGDKKAAKLSQAGLTVGGAAKSADASVPKAKKAAVKTNAAHPKAGESGKGGKPAAG
jgi:DNA polymerase III alpha subunit